MSSARFERLAALFDHARGLPADRRAGFLDETCAGDASLRADVERLLVAHDRAGDFIEAPAITHLPPDAADQEASIVGRTFGAYRVVREIARGGMGAVHLAERADGEFEHRAALKLIKRGMDTDLVLRRFRTERQILAGLEHPNVARLLDGGSTPDGRPYFVMEYVDGEPIDQYASARRLSIRQRLELFLQVCDAVEYAHGKLVVHRDIKPANILVTPRGVPKLLDFGIAKVLASEPDPSTGTITGARLLTPEYASPEQIEGGQVTATSDVYSLGVVLYKLLTGHSPYRLTNRDPLSIAEAVRTTDPERPSTAVTEGDAAERRGPGASSTGTPAADAMRLRRELRGDLDTIVLTALRKDPLRRYPSVAELADDIRRHLDGRPVHARPDGLGYRVSRFAKRNRAQLLASGIAGAAVLIIALGVVALRWPSAAGGVLSTHDRILVADLADHSGDSTLAAAVSEALRVDLTQSSYVRVLSQRQIRSGLARMARSPDVALDDTLARELAVREGVKAFVTGSVGRIGASYALTAQLVGAEKGDLLAAVRETAADSSGVVNAVGRLSASLRARMGEPLRNIRSTPALAAVTTPSLEALRLYTLGNHAARAGERDSSIRLFEHAVAIDTGFAFAYRALGNAYADAGESGRTMQYFAHAIANSDRLPYYERYHTIASHALNYLQDYPAAISAFERVLERYPDDIVALNNLGYAYSAEKRFVQQESLLARAIGVDSTILSVHLTLAMAAVNNGDYALAQRQIDWVAGRDSGFKNLRLARIYLAASRQDWATAEEMARARIAAAPNDSSDLPDGYETLSGILMARGRFSEGERVSRAAMTVASKVGAYGHVFSSAIRDALLELRRGDTAVAVAELERALAAVALDSVPEADRRLDDFARVFAAAGRVARARDLVALAERQSIDRVLKVNPPRHWSRGVIALVEGHSAMAVAQLDSADRVNSCPICVLPDLARAYIAAGRADSAIAVYERYVSLPWEWRFETDDTEMGPALTQLAALYRERGDTARATATESRLLQLRRGAVQTSGRRKPITSSAPSPGG